MCHSPLRAVLLVSALVMCGCATVQVNDQWRESSSRENERIAAASSRLPLLTAAAQVDVRCTQ